MDNFRDRVIKEYGDYGFKFFRETYWSSSLQKTDLQRIRSLLSKNNFNDIDVSLAGPSDNNSVRNRWLTYYDQSGACNSLVHPVPIPAGSNHLKLTFCYTSAESMKNNQAHSIVIVNALRLVFGVPVARELIITRFFFKDKEQSDFPSDEGFASFFDSQDLNIFDDPAIEQSELIDIPQEAAFLLDKSFAQTYPKERFILMWLAFEAIINSIIGKGNNGGKREMFFKNILKSDIANAEIYRLFKLRCILFKEGQSSDKYIDIENDCWSLYAAIQISILKDCEQRRAFLSGYEDSVKKRAQFVP